MPQNEAVLVKNGKSMLNSTLLLLGGLSGWEVVLIVLVVLLLFGGKKIPELMKGLGKGVRSFKEGMNEVTDELNKPVEKDQKEADKK